MEAKRKLTRRLAEVNQVRIDLLDELQDLDHAELTARPIPDKWSILEIVEHLVLVEEAFLGALDPDRDEPLRRSWKHAVLYRVVMLILRFDIPVQVPARAMVPAGEAGLSELRSRWDESQRRLRAFAEGLNLRDLKAPVAAHPVAGPMTPGQSVAMLDVHLRRHIRQIRKRLGLLASG